jgi:NAD(P)-dependent dehydrogenase (short-subunit alcohol dehydrogenase family)
MKTTKTAVVTGGTSGLGEAAARALSAAGWAVVVVGRDEARGEAIVGELRSAGRDASFVAADLFTVKGVRAAARAILAKAPRVDLLVNNAGGTFSKTVVTEDGLERTVALNLMAPFVLTEELMPSLEVQRGRVVNLVTGIPKGAKATPEQLVGAGAGAGIGAYTRAKLALSALTREQQRRHGGRGVTFVSLHPGIIPGTRFGQDIPAFLRAFGAFVARLFRFASSLEQAAERYVLVGTGPVKGGSFYDQGRESEPPTLAADPAFQRAVWEAMARVAGNRAATTQRAAAAHAMPS